jgi:hypothetical protein
MRTSGSGAPSPNGRDRCGRFAPGNPGGPGNPAGGKAEQLRHALLNAVSETDIRDIVAALVASAKVGEIAAAREVLNRVMGRPTDADTLARIERLEALLAGPSMEARQ